VQNTFSLKEENLSKNVTLEEIQNAQTEDQQTDLHTDLHEERKRATHHHHTKQKIELRKQNLLITKTLRTHARHRTPIIYMPSKVERGCHAGLRH
jgi:hypothetical protein